MHALSQRMHDGHPVFISYIHIRSPIYYMYICMYGGRPIRTHNTRFFEVNNKNVLLRAQYAGI